MKALVCTAALKPHHIEEIKETAKEAGVELYLTPSHHEIPPEAADAEIAYGYGMNILKAEELRANKSLRWLGVMSAGVDYLMKPGLFANEDVIITNASGAYGVTIAEHIIGVSLMMMRNLTFTYAESLQGRWAMLKPQKSLKDCRITVLGTGDIGTCFAKRAKAFEPEKITGVSRSGRTSETVYDAMLSIEKLDTVLPETDLLVMSLPGTPETEGILSKKRIELLPDGAYIVNVGRGSAIDYDALMKELDSGRLGGAALDVFPTEPLPAESPLWKTKNLLITPHSAGNLTLGYTLDRNVAQFCENLREYAAGRPLHHVIDKTKGY